MLTDEFFNCKNKDTYPPFKNGLYLEEYFYKRYFEINPKTKRKYIPVKWTNFQIEPWFRYKYHEMQRLLDEWIEQNPSNHGYFTVVQHDDGPFLRLPENTIIYGACIGHIPIPLIYEDINMTLDLIPKKTFNEKSIFCSFVGNITSNKIEPNVRRCMFDKLLDNKKFKLIDSGGWTANVNENLQNLFISTTIDSKFALAPRGYGRSSFRFFECFKLGTIPIYIWNDEEWLPFKNYIDYKKLCISIHISEIDNLESILELITEKDYNNFFKYYDKVKYLFELEGMYEMIIQDKIITENTIEH